MGRNSLEVREFDPPGWKVVGSNPDFHTVTCGRDGARCRGSPPPPAEAVYHRAGHRLCFSHWWRPLPYLAAGVWVTVGGLEDPPSHSAGHILSSPASAGNALINERGANDIKPVLLALTRPITGEESGGRDSGFGRKRWSLEEFG
ncbi:unnamed protein product [Gadus morhua 'NCC']